MDIHRGHARYKDHKTHFGHQDFYHAQASGKSNQEIKDWAMANKDKMGNGGVGGDLWNTIMALDTGGGSSGGGGGGGGGRSNAMPSNVDPFNTDPFFMDEDGEKTTSVRESQIDVWDPTDQEQYDTMLGDAFNQTINQSASIDNRMQNNFSNNTFGAGANVGNNNSVNNISQSASQEINKNRGDAKERARKYLVFEQGY